jgi:hypothetical protein
MRLPRSAHRRLVALVTSSVLSGLVTAPARLQAQAVAPIPLTAICDALEAEPLADFSTLYSAAGSNLSELFENPEWNRARRNIYTFIMQRLEAKPFQDAKALLAWERSVLASTHHCLATHRTGGLRTYLDTPGKLPADLPPLAGTIKPFSREDTERAKRTYDLTQAGYFQDYELPVDADLLTRDFLRTRPPIHFCILRGNASFGMGRMERLAAMSYPDYDRDCATALLRDNGVDALGFDWPAIFSIALGGRMMVTADVAAIRAAMQALAEKAAREEADRAAAERRRREAEQAAERAEAERARVEADRVARQKAASAQAVRDSRAKAARFAAGDFSGLSECSDAISALVQADVPLHDGIRPALAPTKGLIAMRADLSKFEERNGRGVGILTAPRDVAYARVETDARTTWINRANVRLGETVTVIGFYTANTEIIGFPAPVVLARCISP